MTRREYLDDAIDRVAAALTTAPEDSALAGLIVARITTADRPVFTWPRFAFAGCALVAVAVASMVVADRRDDRAVTTAAVETSSAGPGVVNGAGPVAPVESDADARSVEREPSPTYVAHRAASGGAPPMIARLGGPQSIALHEVRPAPLSIAPVTLAPLELPELTMAEIPAPDDLKESR